MISRNLFFKLLKEDLKRRIWAVALATLALFLFLPVYCAILIGNYGDSVSNDYIIKAVTSLLSTQSAMPIFITITGAIICGLSSFFYLHSRKKVDLYHSVPVRRETFFVICYLNGIMIYMIPYVFNLILCFIILQINGFMSVSMLAIALSAFVVNLLFYSLIYTIVVISVMLTGNFIISCFGTGVFLLYGPMIMMLKGMYFSDFFKTYYTKNNSEWNFLFLSPFGNYLNIIRKIDTVLNKEVVIDLITVLIVTVIFIGFALFLYKKRPSEAAGKAMAYSISRPIIKFLLVIPITLGGGIIFREISYHGADGWFLFGLIFAFFLSYGIIEIIYNFDIRCAFRYKKQMLFSALFVLIIAGIFQFDIFRYDSYAPQEDKIKSMSVAVSGLDDVSSYYSADAVNGDSITYQLKEMELTNFDSAYKLAKQGISNPVKETDDMKSFSYYIKYTLKGGREVYRVYSLSAKDNYDNLKNIFANEEFKNGHYPINTWKANDIKSISCYNYIESKDFSLSQEEKQQFLELYKEDLNSLTLDDLRDSAPLATMSFAFYNKNYDSQSYIYSSFGKTIGFLKEHGFNVEDVLNTDNILQIQITNNAVINAVNNNSNNFKTYGDKKVDEGTLSITDKEQIKEIYSAVISNDWYWSNQSIVDVNTNVDVTITFKQDEYGNQATNYFYFKQGQIPDFIKDALSITD